MKKTLPAYCYARKRGGRTYIYFERWGRGARIHAEPGTPAFAIEYAKLLNGVTAQPTKRDFAALVKAYHASDRYRRLAVRTTKDYDKVTDWVIAKLGPLPVSGMQRKDVIRARDANSAARRFANYIVQVLRVLLEYAHDLGWIDQNPAKGVELLPSDGEPRLPWPDDLVTAYRAEATGRALLIFEMLRGTGQRIGDVLKMRWDDLQDGGVHIRQGKTKTRLWVPLTPALRAVLASTPKAGMTICAQQNGKPTSYRGAADLVMAVRRKIGAEAFDIHSLRHTVASELLEAGCTDEQIAAVTGHTSLASVKRYTATVRQISRAKEAMEKRK
jgi:integrase